MRAGGQRLCLVLPDIRHYLSGRACDLLPDTGGVPWFSSGKNMTDYAATFHAEAFAVSKGTGTVNLGEKYVFLEVLK